MTRALRWWIVALALMPAAALAQLTVTIVAPGNNALVGNLVYVAVKVNGGDAGAAVTASLGGVTGPLAKGTHLECVGPLEPPLCTFQPAWVGTLDVSAVPSGTYEFLVTASDGVGGTFPASRTVILDRIPAVQVTRPTPDMATWLQQRVTASCTDDLGCVSLEARIGATTVLAGTNSIDAVIDLSTYDGQAVTLVVVARDTRGQLGSRDIALFVEGSPHVRALARVPGMIMDASGDRILFRSSSDPKSLVIRARASGSDTVVSTGSEIQRAGLTNAGAAFTVFQNYPNSFMSTSRSWEAGTVVQLGTPPCCFVTTNGAQVQWMEDTYRILWRNPASATTTEVAPTSSNHNSMGMALKPAAGGFLAFFDPDGALKLFDQAATPAVQTVLPGPICRAGNPRTDGSTIVYERGSCAARQVSSIKDGVVRLVLDGGQYDSVDYDVSGGWIGASRAYIGTQGRVVRADPQGSLTSVLLPANTQQLRMETIHSDGTLVFIDGGRHVSVPPSAQTQPVGSGEGKAHFIGGGLHVALGDTLFAYQRAAPFPSKVYHHFGNASMGMGTPAIPVTLTNDSASSLNVTSVVSSTHFAATHDCATLAPGQQCTVMAAFRPGAVSAPLNARVDLGGEFSVTSSAMPAPYRISLWGIAERSLVFHYYRWILGRGPDPGGQVHWEGEASRMASLGADLNEAWYAMAMAFFASAEYAATPRTNAAYVTNLYQTFFGRDPDAAGLAYWSGQVDSGLPREVALAAFMFSPEFTALSRSVFGTTAARPEVDMVMDFYRGLLGRLPDSSGFNHWVGQFRAAQCLGAPAVLAQVEAISAAFAAGSEYAARQRPNPGYVGDLYNAFLRRGGDLPGVKFWIDQLNAGRSRDQLRRDFMASPEFSARVQAVVGQGCAQP